MPITKHNYTVRRVEDLADTMRAAFRIAQSGRKGPVLVDIPKDITAASCEFTPKAPELIRTVTRYNEEDVKKAAQMINESERPIVYFGGGVRSAAGCQPLRDLLEKTGMPATYTLMAAGVLSYGEPHNLGLLGMHGCYAANKAIDEADLVIAVGTRFSDRVALNPDSFAKRAKIIQIDIDPSELGKNVDVDLSLTGDASYILQAILPYVEKTEHKLWMEQIRGWQKNDYKPADSDTELKPHQIIDEICNQAGPEAVYVTDVGQHQMWAAQYLHHTKSRGFLTSGGLGTMGFGYGAAIGEELTDVDTRLSGLPAYVILNEGLTSDVLGDSDVEPLMGLQDNYNHMVSDDQDALKFNLFPQTVFTDASEDCMRAVKISPGAMIDLQSDPAQVDKQAQVSKLETHFNYDARFQNSLDTLLDNMYSLMSCPRVTTEYLKAVGVSGKAMRAMYWDLQCRCEERWAEWDTALKWLVREIIEQEALYGLHDWSGCRFTVTLPLA